MMRSVTESTIEDMALPSSVIPVHAEIPRPFRVINTHL